jgi:hypothetical protein
MLFTRASSSSDLNPLHTFLCIPSSPYPLHTLIAVIQSCATDCDTGPDLRHAKGSLSPQVVVQSPSLTLQSPESEEVVFFFLSLLFSLLLVFSPITTRNSEHP